MDSNDVLKVFIVDDDVFFGKLIQRQLEILENINITFFDNALDFLDALTDKPDIVVLDYMIPVRNGIQLMEAVKKKHPETKVIILSGQDSLNVVVEAYDQGADRYLIKDDTALVELKHSIQRLRNT